MQKLAIYDMDRTVTRTGTYTPFLIFTALRLAPWRLLIAPAAMVFMLAYALKLISRSRLKELNMLLLIGRRSRPEKLAPVIAAYADKIVAQNCYAEAIAQIESDRAAGYRLVLATASYHLYVDAIAERLGFADVIATALKTDALGRILARIDGENCYDTAKLRKIEAWMEREALNRRECEIRSYSDHMSDMPLLELADHPHATNPSLPLRREAERRGWPIYDWE